MNKLRYEKPFAEIVEFDTSDVVVVASGDGGGDSDNQKNYWCLFTRDHVGQGFICPLFNAGVASA